MLVHFLRSSDLLEQTVVQNRNAVTHGQSFGLVVGHVHGGDAQLTLQRSNLGTGLDTQLGVQVGQRLIHEEDLRLTDNCTAHCHTLTLTTGKCLRLTIQVGLQVEDACCFLNALSNLSLGGACDLQCEAHVLANGHVRVQSVVLEDHCDVAVLRLYVGDVLIANEDTAGVHVFKTCEHSQGRGLATTGRTDENQEFTILDLKIELIDCWLVRPGIDSGRLVESYSCHIEPPPAVRAGRSFVETRRQRLHCRRACLTSDVKFALAHHSTACRTNSSPICCRQCT